MTATPVFTRELLPPEATSWLPAASDAPLTALLPWRDPHSVSPAELAEYRRRLELACEVHPRSAGLRTLLGIVHAMNYDVYKSMDTLEQAVGMDPQHFWARFKYAELFYRVRAIERAEQETLKAMELAGSGWEVALARRQLQEIRRLRREGILRPAWTKSLRLPVYGLMGLVLLLGVMWR